MSGSDSKRGKARKQPRQPFRRWSKKTLAIVGAAVLAGISAAITATITGLIGASVSNIRVVRLKYGRAYRGTFVSLAPQGVEEARQLVLNMDESAPFAEDRQTGKAFFDEKVITLNPDEEETFKIWAVETRGSNRYKLALDYRTEGQDGTTMIDDNGYPFTLSAFACVGPKKVSYVNVYEMG